MGGCCYSVETLCALLRGPTFQPSPPLPHDRGTTDLDDSPWLFVRRVRLFIRLYGNSQEELLVHVPSRLVKSWRSHNPPGPRVWKTRLRKSIILADYAFAPTVLARAVAL